VERKKYELEVGEIVCCSVLQCVAVCCSVLQCVAVCCSVLQCVAVRCSMLQCVAVRCSVFQCVAACCSVLQCVAVMLQCVERQERLEVRERMKEGEREGGDIQRDWVHR